MCLRTFGTPCTVVYPSHSRICNEKEAVTRTTNIFFEVYARTYNPCHGNNKNNLLFHYQITFNGEKLTPHAVTWSRFISVEADGDFEIDHMGFALAGKMTQMTTLKNAQK
jgi:hypothetical protein